jgi:hypothetical protein
MVIAMYLIYADSFSFFLYFKAILVHMQAKMRV